MAAVPLPCFQTGVVVTRGTFPHRPPLQETYAYIKLLGHLKLQVSLSMTLSVLDVKSMDVLYL